MTCPSKATWSPGDRRETDCADEYLLCPPQAAHPDPKCAEKNHRQRQDRLVSLMLVKLFLRNLSHKRKAVNLHHSIDIGLRDWGAVHRDKTFPIDSALTQRIPSLWEVCGGQNGRSDNPPPQNTQPQPSNGFLSGEFHGGQSNWKEAVLRISAPVYWDLKWLICHLQVSSSFKGLISQSGGGGLYIRVLMRGGRWEILHAGRNPDHLFYSFRIKHHDNFKNTNLCINISFLHSCVNTWKALDQTVRNYIGRWPVHLWSIMSCWGYRDHFGLN